VLQLSWSNDGTTVHTASSVDELPLTPGRIQIKVELDVNNGAGGNTVKFFTAPPGGSYTQLGAAVVTAGTTSVFDSNAPVQVGNGAIATTTTYSGVSATGPGVNGKIYSFLLVAGIAGAGATAASPNFQAQTPGALSFTDTQGNTWRMYGTAEISDRDYRFHGEVPGWPQSWDPSGRDVYTAITPSGPLRRLGRSTRPLQSAMYRGMSRLRGSTTPIDYWPCEDGSDATEFWSATGGNAMNFTSGTPSLSSDSSFACSAALPTCNGASWAGVTQSYGSSPAVAVRWLMHVPSGGDTNNGGIIKVEMGTGTAKYWEIVYTTGGALTVNAYNSVPTLITSTGPVGFTVNGKLLRCSLELSQVGSSVNYYLTTIEPGSSSGLYTAGSISGTLGACTAVTGSSSATLTGTALGHFSVQAHFDNLWDLGSQLNAWKGEYAGRRFARLCAEEGIPCRIVGLPAFTPPMGNQTLQTLPTLLQECEDVDRGMTFEPRQAVALGYRVLTSMCQQTAAVTLDYPSAHLAFPLQPVDDDQLLCNDITVQAPGGSEAREYVVGGPLSILQPPNGVGRYDNQVTCNVYTGAQLVDEATWILNVGTVNQPRYPQITVDLSRSEASSLLTTVPVPDVGDYVKVTSPPSWLPPGDINQIISGVTETLGGYTWTIRWNCQPELPYETLPPNTADPNSWGV